MKGPALPRDLFRVPAAAPFDRASSVLVAGAGGGFDVFAGLPLWFALKRAGKSVHLASLSSVALESTDAHRIGPVAWRVRHSTVAESPYFPEKHLAAWFHHQGIQQDIYCFQKCGVQPLRAAYLELVERLRVDTVVLVDGGTDILMRGDEAGLGTPAEDMASLAAVHRLELAGDKLISCLGFGIDAYHGICHAHFLENVAALESAGGYLGAHSLHLSMPEVAAFRDVVEYVHERMPRWQSIVHGSILSALEGRFGDVHRSERTRSSKLFINPLMSMYWHFALDAVASRSLYLERLEGTETIADIAALIEAFRRTVTLRPRMPIPC